MEDVDRNETYAAALRIAAKLMAFKALKTRRSDVSKAEGWLTHAVFADALAEEYEAKP